MTAMLAQTPLAPEQHKLVESIQESSQSLVTLLSDSLDHGDPAPSPARLR